MSSTQILKLLSPGETCADFGYESKGNKQLAFTLSRKDIAILGNTTYESVIRTLSIFEKEKLIQCVRKNILIVNESTLKLIADGK